MTAAVQSDPEVSIAIARDPSLVRTVRLVAAAVARRADCEDSLIEEIRLAVGEACAVMIGLDDGPGRSDGHVGVRIRATGRFEVTVSGRVEGDDDGYAELGVDPWALLRGLCEDLEVNEDGDATVLRMSWQV
jgi:hypothetical protein